MRIRNIKKTKNKNKKHETSIIFYIILSFSFLKSFLINLNYKLAHLLQMKLVSYNICMYNDDEVMPQFDNVVYCLFERNFHIEIFMFQVQPMKQTVTDVHNIHKRQQNSI